MKAEEILMFPNEVAMIFHRNVPVILSWMVAFNHPDFRNAWAGNQAGLGRTATKKSVGLLLACLLFAWLALTLLPIDPVLE